MTLDGKNLHNNQNPPNVDQDPTLSVAALPTNYLQHQSIVSPVRTYKQFCDALALVHNEYVREGLMPTHPSGLRFNKYLLHPQTTVMASNVCESPLGTITFIPFTSELQIPAYSQFNSDISKLVPTVGRAGELTLFAVATDKPKSVRDPIRTELMRTAYHYAEYFVDCLAIVTHPSHARLYKRAFSFEAKSDVISYEQAQGAPGQLLILKMEHLRTDRTLPANLLQREILAKPVHPEIYARRFNLQKEQVRELLTLNPEVLHSLTETEKEFFNCVYEGVVRTVLQDLRK